MKNDVRTSLHSLYVNTDYVIPAIHLNVQVNRRNPELAAFMQKQAFKSFAILTAHNPKSELLAPNENIKRDNELKLDLEKLNMKFERTVAKAKDNNSWPPEAGFCVFDISEEEVRILASKYGQYAIVYGVQSFDPKLIWI